MAAPIDLRNDFDSVSLRAPREEDQGRDPEPSSAGVGRGLRWWQQDGCVADRRRRSADHSRLGAALQRPRTGRAGRWEVTGRTLEGNADHRRALAEVVEAGPVPAVDGVVRWRRKDLARWLLETFAISLDVTTVGRELKALGFAKISAWPFYARPGGTTRKRRDRLYVEAFKRAAATGKKAPFGARRTGEASGRGSRHAARRRDRAVVGQDEARRAARRISCSPTPMGQTWRAPAGVRELQRGDEWANIFGADLSRRRGKAPGWSCPGLRHRLHDGACLMRGRPLCRSRRPCAWNRLIGRSGRLA